MVISTRDVTYILYKHLQLPQIIEQVAWILRQECVDIVTKRDVPRVNFDKSDKKYRKIRLKPWLEGQGL